MTLLTVTNLIVAYQNYLRNRPWISFRLHPDVAFCSQSEWKQKFRLINFKPQTFPSSFPIFLLLGKREKQFSYSFEKNNFLFSFFCHRKVSQCRIALCSSQILSRSPWKSDSSYAATLISLLLCFFTGTFFESSLEIYFRIRAVEILHFKQDLLVSCLGHYAWACGEWR